MVFYFLFFLSKIAPFLLMLVLFCVFVSYGFLFLIFSLKDRSFSTYACFILCFRVLWFFISYFFSQRSLLFYLCLFYFVFSCLMVFYFLFFLSKIAPFLLML